jgi:sugar transferase (PEP-CTERM/EpsH1 system associated)
MRVLFLTHRLPYAPNRGDRLRAYHIARTLAPTVDLEIVSLAHDAEEMAQVNRLEAVGARVTAVRVPHVRNYAKGLLHLAGGSPLTHVLLDAPGLTDTLHRIVSERPPDAVLAYCSGMARFALEPPLSRFPLIVDLVDVDSQKWAALSQLSRWPIRSIYGREARHLARFEQTMSAAAVATVVVNDRERDALCRLAPDARIAVVPNGVDLPPLVPPDAPAERPIVVFCGVMNYTPNVDGAQWFCEHVWPRIRAQRSDAELLLVGSHPARAIQRLHSQAHGIEVTGTVDDVRPYLWRSALAIAPLLTARGIQNKVLEAVGAGLPAVVSVPVFDGLPPAVHSACRVGPTAEAFAEASISLLAMSAGERRHVAGSADMNALTWETQLRPLRDLLTDCGNRHAIAV